MEAHEKVAPSVIWSIIGTAGVIVALAPSLGPTYGGICLAALNWRFNFIFTLPHHRLLHHRVPLHERQ